MRRTGQPPRRDVRYRHRPGVYALMPRGGALLVAAATDRPGWFLLPGGGVDPGESPLAALHREVMEETGWRLASPRRLGAYRRFTWMPDYGIWGEKVCHVYLARPVRAVAAPTEPLQGPAWLPLSAAPDTLAVDGERHFAARLAALALSRPSILTS